MIINETCYDEVKKSLDEIKRNYAESLKKAGFDLISAPQHARSGSAEHEIALREKELALYEAVISGQAPLPDLGQYRLFPDRLVGCRIAKHVSPESLATKCTRPNHPLTGVEIIGYEIFDYRPAKFGTMLTIADVLEDAADNASGETDIILDSKLEASLLDWKTEQESYERKFYVDKRQWWQTYGDSPQEWYKSLQSKSPGRLEKLIDNSELNKLAGFSEALIMWRLAKKWSYRQLAEAAGIQWIVLWHFEQTGYYGSLFETMLEIAEVLAHGNHEPSDYSFERENTKLEWVAE